MKTLFLGKNEGVDWKIEVRPHADQHYCLVKVGGIVKVTDYFNTFDDAKNAGCTLMADTLAQLMDVQNAA